MGNRRSYLDRLIDRLDRLDPASVQNYVLRLAREKGFLETVFNTIREGVVVIERSLRIQYTNRAARGLLGMQEDVAGQRIDRYLRDVAWARLMASDSAEWHRVSLQEIEVFYPTHRHVSFYLVPLPAAGAGGGIGLATIILHDVTAARRDTESAIESRRVEAITALAASVAHEIGNPLNSLTIHLQLLQRALQKTSDEALAKGAAQYLDVAVHEVRRLDSIVNNFLRAVRPVPPDLTLTSVEKVLAEALEFMGREIEDRGVLVQASWPEHLPQVLADADQLKQAFFNLIKNAIQAMPDGGVLQVGCDARDQFLEVRFADSGKGITRDNLSRVMDPYFTTRPEGTGLGLVIVERVVHSHGGQFGIESEPGAGTAFTIRLPLQERHVRLLAAAAGGGAGAGAAGPPPWSAELPSSGKVGAEAGAGDPVREPGSE